MVWVQGYGSGVSWILEDEIRSGGCLGVWIWGGWSVESGWGWG